MPSNDLVMRSRLSVVSEMVGKSHEDQIYLNILFIGRHTQVNFGIHERVY